MTMTTEHATAVRAFVRDIVTTVIDNNTSIYVAVNEAARDAVLDAGAVDPARRYRRMLAGVSDGLMRHHYAEEIGSRIADVVQAELPSADDNIAGAMLVELLDFTDTQQWAMIAEHYFPKVADLPSVEAL